MHAVLAHADALLAFVYLSIVGAVVYLATGPLGDANFWAAYTPDPGPWCERVSYSAELVWFAACQNRHDQSLCI